jgi:hypothetical protein
MSYGQGGNNCTERPVGCIRGAAKMSISLIGTGFASPNNDLMEAKLRVRSSRKSNVYGCSGVRIRQVSLKAIGPRSKLWVGLLFFNSRRSFV